MIGWGCGDAFAVARRAAMLLATGAVLLGVQAAAAIGLGPANVSSALGEPLRLSVPVTLQPDEEAGCIQVRPGSGDLPGVFNTRAQVVRAGAATRIEIRSAQPINEPAIGLVVSVGCTSPIARDYVLFLDPPVVTPTVVNEAAAAPLRRVNPMPTPVRRVPSTAARVGSTGDGTEQPRPRPRPARPKPRVAPVAPVAVPDAGATARTTPAPAASATAPRAAGADRLSVVPTEAVRTPPIAAEPASPVVGVPVPTAPVDTAVASAAITAASADAAAREDALRQQQAALQAQIKSLGDQIAALRVQATTLAERNQELEQASTSPWWLIALAVIAILVAAWMAWRYLLLRRSVEGSAWWAANTVQPAGMTARSQAVVDEADGELDPGTRMAARPATRTDLRGPAAAIASGVSAERAGRVERVERAVTSARPTTYPAAMDTDFTVSDIEAAMATVRTVSPPRPPASSTSHADSDFAPLGGPTLPSPFADPPPGAPGASPARPATAPVAAAPAAGQFVDFDIPPIQPLSGAAARKPPPAAPAKTPDFLLDAPDGFDPLGSDSMKTTVLDGANRPTSDDSHSPTSLDFELPTATQIMALTAVDETPPTASHVRHGGTLLDDLFDTSDGHGVDTILDLDERHGQPLSMTEVDRLIATDLGSEASAERAPRTRMAKFADLMNRVDEAAAAEPLRAIALLRQFVLRDEQIPTLLWLRLFELYRQVDKKPVYNALADHFARRYHRPMVAWGQGFADRVPQTPLSAHADLDREIESKWGTEEGRARLESLLCGREEDDTIVFNAVLQHDLLDAAKIFPAAPPADHVPAPTDQR